MGVIQEAGQFEDTVLELTGPQSSFWLSEYQYPLFVGGFGSGKSVVAALKAIDDLMAFPGANIGCYAPTYDLLNLITGQYIIEYLEEAGLKFKHNKSDHIISVEGHGKLILRSLSNPERIIGYQVLRSHVDEIDTLKQKDANNAWNKIIARNRQGFKNESGEFIQNTVRAYTTPEGYEFAYNRWVKQLDETNQHLYKLYRAPTASNPHLPPDYISNLRATYPAELIDAYLEAKFINLTSGAVYPKYSRKLNGSEERVEGFEPLEVGMDFNVMKGAAVIHVMRGDGEVHAVDEIFDAYDTDEQIAALKDKYPHNPITIYPDNTGDRRTSSNTSRSDIKKLKKAGFRVKHDSSNPAIKDRVNSFNAQICNGNGERNYFVNHERAPNLTASLEQQIWGPNGQPDKTAGLDHIVDGAGYFMVKKFPLHKPEAVKVSVRHFAR